MVVSLKHTEDEDEEPLEYRTSGKALMNQIKSILKAIEAEGEPMAVKLTKSKRKFKKWNYLMFDAPE